MSEPGGRLRRSLSGLLPAAGSGVLAASSLAVYLRDMRLQAFCAGNLVCRGYTADPRVLAASVGFAILAAVLAGGCVFAARHGSGRPGGRPRVALALFVVAAASFAALVAILSMSGAGWGVYDEIPLAIWAFIGIGYSVVWVLVTFPAALVGAWAWPARVLAGLQGLVAAIATLVTLAYALGPGPMFL